MNLSANPPDVLVIGAGVVGLWAARRAIKAGKRVVVLDRAGAGAGASGGFLGALMPHMPDKWNEKKQFQFEGLSGIGEVVTALEADTGFSCGFRRCGRLMPIRHENTLEIVRRRIGGAQRNWPGFSMAHLEAPFTDIGADWLGEAMAPYGATYDTLSARIDPRAYVDALAAYVRVHGELLEGVEVRALEPEKGQVRLADGGALAAGDIVVAAGWQSYELLQPFMGHMAEGERLGQGVKGQAVLLEHAHDDDRPIIYDDGSYVVPHPGNRIAVGSTSRNGWDACESPSENSFDPQDMAFCSHAMELAPSLKNAPIIERWAAVRPRNRIRGRGTEPWFGKVPGHDNLTALIGGFKISFAVAHVAE